MANRSFDFGKLKRSFYTTRLKDKRVLVVEMPQKSTFEKMQELSSIGENVDGEDTYNSMLALMAEILSNNRAKTKITADYLAKEGYNIEDIVAYINDYANFVKSIKSNPN